MSMQQSDKALRPDYAKKFRTDTANRDYEAEAYSISNEQMFITPITRKTGAPAGVKSSHKYDLYFIQTNLVLLYCAKCASPQLKRNLCDGLSCKSKMMLKQDSISTVRD